MAKSKETLKAEFIYACGRRDALSKKPLTGDEEGIIRFGAERALMRWKERIAADAAQKPTRQILVTREMYEEE
jgi:hypothetical protein